jgi:hypothetical protein
MIRARTAPVALLGVFVLVAVGCNSGSSCGERHGLFGRASKPVTMVPVEATPCGCGTEFPVMPAVGQPGVGVNGNTGLPPGILPPPNPGLPSGPMPGTLNPGEAQPLPYSPQSGRAGTARMTGKP